MAFLDSRLPSKSPFRWTLFLVTQHNVRRYLRRRLLFVRCSFSICNTHLFRPLSTSLVSFFFFGGVFFSFVLSFQLLRFFSCPVLLHRSHVLTSFSRLLSSVLGTCSFAALLLLVWFIFFYSIYMCSLWTTCGVLFFPWAPSLFLNILHTLCRCNRQRFIFF